MVISEPFQVETHYIFSSFDNCIRVRIKSEPKLCGIWKWLIPLVKIPTHQKLYVKLNSLKEYLETHR